MNHKTEGKLALPWSAQVGDDYVYAAIPEDLLTTARRCEGSERRRRKTRATSAKDKVLDEFKELLGGRSDELEFDGIRSACSSRR